MRPRQRSAPVAGGATHRIRIIGGKWKRTPIPVPEVAGLRPTPDRVRETLFNWLGQRLDGLRCLDPFAGSGALGFEAASRGAGRVVMIEHNREALAAIAGTVERLGATQIEAIAGDAFAIMRKLAAAGERFDLVFLDPPFDEGLLAPAIEALPPLLAPGARVHVESGESFVAPAGWRIERAARAGQVRYHLMCRDVEPGAGARPAEALPRRSDEPRGEAV